MFKDAQHATVPVTAWQNDLSVREAHTARWS